MNSLHINKSVAINAHTSKVWDALINPELIKQYLFGTEAVSEWKTRKEILFKGIWEGREYNDRGIILELEPEKIFKYSYLSSFSGLEDKVENYSIITFRIWTENKKTILNLMQENFVNEDARSHSDKNWEYVLNKMKEVIEE